MTRLLSILALCLCPAVAAAKPVPVQSGEHADFSRLVFLFGEVPDWTFGRVDGGYELRPASPGLSYDLDRVFDLIPKRRISAVEPRPEGRVFIAVPCDCHGDAFEIRTGLVIDIKDGTAGAKAAFEAWLPGADSTFIEPDAAQGEDRADPPVSPPLPFRFQPVRTGYIWDQVLALDIAAQGPPWRTGSDPDPPEVARPQAVSPAPASRSAADSATADAPDAGDASRGTGPVSSAYPADVVGIQAELMWRIGQAAAQGLVEAPPQAAPPEGVTNTPALSARAEDLAGLTDPDTAEARPPGPVVNVRIDSAAGQGVAAGASGPAMTPNGHGCIASDRLNLAQWGASLEAGLADVRSGIFDERGQPDPDGIGALARRYLYLTFGAEARSLIESLAPDLPDAAIYLAMADIMDRDLSGDPQAFGDQAGCDTRAALWAILSRRAIGRADRPATEAVLSAFDELPLHLRRHLGPGLARRYLEHGDVETARTIRNMIARAPGDHGGGFQMVEAEISLAEGDEEDALDQLAAIADSGGSHSPEALVRLIDTRVDAGREVTETVRDSAITLAYEHQGTGLGAELTRVALRAAISHGDFVSALRDLSAGGEEVGLESWQIAELRRELFQAAAEKADDAEFLQIALSGPLGLDGSAGDGRVLRAVASRLLALGLAGPAKAVLTEDRDAPDPEDRLLYAEAHLLDGRPDLAIGYLAGLSSDRAQQLRARAHEAGQRYGEAAEIFASLGQDSDAASAFWRGQSWSDPARLSPGIRRTAAEWVVRPSENGSDGAPPHKPLAQNRALIEQSREARAILAQLLTGTALP